MAADGFRARFGDRQMLSAHFTVISGTADTDAYVTERELESTLEDYVTDVELGERVDGMLRYMGTVDDEGDLPTNPDKGDLYIVGGESTMFWDGSEWVEMSASGGGGTADVRPLTDAEVRAITGMDATYYPDGDGVGY